MEIIMEFFFAIYVELMMFVVPEEKATSKGYRILTIFIAMGVLLGILALFIWGGILIENGNKLGVIPIVIAVVLSVVQILAGMILHDKKCK